jgi:general stress protein YciG
VKTTQRLVLRCKKTGSTIRNFDKQQRGNQMAEAPHSGNPGNFAEDREKAARAGHVGGQHSSGNFANDRERAAAAGRKGGQATHGSSRGDASEETTGPAGQRPGNFAEDREKASEAGRKGGHSSH